MKCVTIYFVFVLTFLNWQNSFGQKAEITAYKSHFETELKGWTKSFASFDLSSITKAGVSSFEDIEYMDIADTAEFYSIYKPALTFSKDKNQFIDIYSYWLNLSREGKTIVSTGGEADQAITLCNFKTKKWMRILFRGTTERIQDVIWITNSKFILVGVRKDDLSKDHPVIYLADTINKTFVSFMSKDNRSVQRKAGYDSPKLLKLKIKEKYL